MKKLKRKHVDNEKRIESGESFYILNHEYDIDTNEDE